jgi:hypothetical protein
MALKRTVSAALAALVCLAVLNGCSTMKTTWRSTRKMYRHYVNTDPTIDLTDQGITDKGLQRLAALFMPVDERLMEMMRTLSCQDTPPEPDWPQQFLAGHSWLSGVAVLDNTGMVRFQAPSTSLRPLDFAPLLEFADRYKLRKQAAAVATDEFGTVVMLAAPYFEHNEWTGLVVAFFDPRNLLHFSPDPTALAVVTSTGQFWPGTSPASEALAGLNWSAVLKGTVQGETAAAGGKWVWVSRYLGQLQLIYLTDVQTTQAVQSAPRQPATPPAPETPPADAASPANAGATATP